MSFRETVRNILPRPLRNAVRNILWLRIDRKYAKRTGRKDFPPAYLRVRVAGTLDVDNFIQAGESCARDLLSSLESIGASPDRFKRVLDFGCGAGRTLKAFHARMPQAKLYGTDIDSNAIAWDRKHLDFGQYDVNALEPPLKYEDGQFDLIYAISVFTHVDERLQDLWLEELKRVSAPGAILLLTVHGSSVAESGKLPPEQLQQFRKNGFLFVRDKSWADYFPDFYQTSFHSRDYIMKHWSRNFEVLDCRELGMDRSQDVVILRRS